jgi:protein SDA1
MAGASTTTTTGAGTRLDVTLKLPQLQDFCKRDPDGYREDYDAQIRRLESSLALLWGKSAANNSNSIIELIQFAAAVSSTSYKGAESDRIAGILKDLMQKNAATLHKDVRKTCVSAIILMRNKGTIQSLDVFELFYETMVTVSDKNMRELLFRHLVSDVRNINKKTRDDKTNRALQTFLHKVVQNNIESTTTGNESSTLATKRAVDMVCELYRRRVWTDERTVAILASAVISPDITVACRAMRFFLNIEEKMAEDARRDEDVQIEKSMVDYHLYSKKTKKRQRQTAREMKNRKRAIQKSKASEGEDWIDATPEDDKGVEASKKLYPAIELLRDPQGLAESVLKRLKTNKPIIKYESKLLMINFITRLVGNHELWVLPLYAYLQKNLTSSQRDVTAVLAYAVQACHNQVPPDEIHGLLQTIAHHFVTERCSEEQMAVGINAIRAICARVPSVMNGDDNTGTDDPAASSSSNLDVEAFARDLAGYAKHRDRSVSMAGKSWLNFVRQVHPGLLQGKDRGPVGAALHKAGAKPLRYGESKISMGVEGADLLVEYEARKAAAARNNADGEEAEEIDEDGIEAEEEDDINDNESEGGEEENTENEEEYEDQEEEEELDSANDEWQDVEEDSEDEEAPELVRFDDTSSRLAAGDGMIDVSKMTTEEREKLKQQVSSTRIFSTSDFIKMQKLVEREQRAKRDPREAARRKRARAKGIDFERLSDDEGWSDEESDDENAKDVHIKGAVNPEDIMAIATRKRQSKAEKLEKVLAGRTSFEAKKREGGSTNVEKNRRKNFLMTKFSKSARKKGKGKGTAPKKRTLAGTHEAKKRRRKL